MVMAPILFYPFAETLWLVVDLIVRPLTLGDLAGHGEKVEAGAPERPGPGEEAAGPE
jgi:hypothetical protein